MDFNCPPVSGNPGFQSLVFSWDPETGKVSGLDAATVRELAKPGAVIDAHPYPRTWKLGREPLKSRTDLAAIIGTRWRVPEELLADYPAAEPSDLNIYDLDGNVVGQVTP